MVEIFGNMFHLGILTVGTLTVRMTDTTFHLGTLTIKMTVKMFHLGTLTV